MVVTLRLLLLLGAALLGALAGCAGPETPAEPVATQLILVPGPWVFEPRLAEVEARVPVTFRNDGGAAHTATFAELGLDLELPAGAEVQHVFEAPGTYGYVCKYHPPDMRGTIVVKDA